MVDMKNIPIIFDENPISRAYLKLFLKENLVSNQIIYLGNNFIFPSKIMLLFKFHKRNFYALELLKRKGIDAFLSQIENFFSLERNFIRDMFNFKNLYEFKSMDYIKSPSINSNLLIEKIKNSNHDAYLISGKQILKQVLKTEKKFIHVHPAYLPEIRGADGSLHSINKNNQYGSTAFFVNEGIDTGEIIYREKYEFKKLKLENLKNFNVNDLYRLWFSFVDPIIRITNLIKLIKSENTTFENDKSRLKIEGKGEYFSFMEKQQLEEVFKKIFY